VTPIAPLFTLVAAFLVAAGIGKLRHPTPTARAFYAAGLPGSEPAVRVLGGVEVVAGVLALVRPGPITAGVVAALYVGFAAFVGFLLVRRPDAGSCGCSGSHETRPSWIHVAMNLAAAALASAVAIAGAPTIGSLVSALGWASLPAAIGLAAAGWLVTVAIAEVPGAIRSWTPPTHRERGLFDPDRHRRADVALSTAGVGEGHPSLWPDHDPSTGLPLEDADVHR
jgi:Methylamine utilisation protein MauE